MIVVSKERTIFVCRECGYEAPKWLGRCPDCGKWNTLAEEIVRPQRGKSSHALSHLQEGSQAIPIADVSALDAHRFSTGFAEFDRVLGQGWLPGAVTLIVGDPGIGKSSLTLQMCAHVARTYGQVLYVTGEESARQVRLRADRLQAIDDALLVMCETNLEVIVQQIETIKPCLVVIDSVQTLFRPDIESAPGSVSQVRESAAELTRVAKALGVATFLVGHVTKDGSLAGPRVLEHIVDTVLYLEGDRHGPFRILRAVKNRFGGTQEIGLFEMGQNGLGEVPDASELFLTDRALHGAGSAVVPTIEGSRPLLVEVQALVSPSLYAAPRRTSDGIDVKRVHLLLAVMEKRAGLVMGASDVYVKVAGGLTASEPAIDLGLVAVLASSFKDKPIMSDTAIFGEVGLAGEIRAVSQPETRIREAQKLRFRRVVLPQSNMKKLSPPEGIELVGVATVSEALQALFG